MDHADNRPDLEKFHTSVGHELNAIKNKIRFLVRHWQTDGEWKESALRAVLRRHLPESTFVGRGFIVSREYSSTQIDLLVLKPNMPTLFKDGDLVLVTPDVSKVIVEVKTKLRVKTEWVEALEKLSILSKKCEDISGNLPWIGLFVYDGRLNQIDHVKETIEEVYKNTGFKINAICCGDALFTRFWPLGEFESGDNPKTESEREYWRIYEMPRFSKSYFISNLVDAACNVDQIETDYSWFAHTDGKRQYKKVEITA